MRVRRCVFRNRAVEDLPLKVFYGVSDIADAIGYSSFCKLRFLRDQVFQGLWHIGRNYL